MWDMADWTVLNNPEMREIIQNAYNHVNKLIKEGKLWRDFEAYEVTSKYWLLRKLCEAGIFKITSKTANHTFYAFNVPLEEVEEKLKMIELRTSEVKIAEEEKKETIPEDFWDVIEGYDDLKELFLASLNADKPVHILLIGGTGTGKSLMLLEVERLKGSVFITAGTSTKVGIRDILINQKPKYLIIDELDKINSSDDLSVLLTLMDYGRVTVAKHGTYVDENLKTWVFAACNRANKLPPELLDRFQKIYLKPYDKETLIRVITKTLVKRHNVNEELAKYIAEKVTEYTDSVREAIRVASICRTKEDVDKFTGLFKKYKL